MARHSPEVEHRLAQDREAVRFYNLDREDGGKRLLKYTIENNLNGDDEMARVKGSKNKPKEAIEIDDGAKPETETPKPVTVAKSGKSSQASQLAEALAFVSVAGTKDDAPYKEHVILNNRVAIASDGQLTAGFPITEELACCPHLELLKSAIAKSGKSLAITELESGGLSIKGDKLRAVVPCIPFTALPDYAVLAPDQNIAPIDDRLKQAFSVCGVLVSEAAPEFIKASMLLEANQCTATNRATLIQYWHGVNLPPSLVVPKIFASAVCKQKSKLVGFGWTEGRSITFHFENGGWIKTLLYLDAYPNVAAIIDAQTNPAPVPVGLFDAIVTVAAFNDDGIAILSDGRVSSHAQDGVGADYEIEGLLADINLADDQIRLIAPYAKQVDFTSVENKIFFFGENMRGVMMACHRNERSEPIEAPPF